MYFVMYAAFTEVFLLSERHIGLHYAREHNFIYILPFSDS